MNINDILSAPFTFTKRKNFTPCDTRPLWKSSLVVLILGIAGRDNSASLKKIHTANWVTKNKEHHTSYMLWAGKDDRKRPNIRLEPAIDRVINLLVSNKLALKVEGKVSLTQMGIELFEELDSENIYTVEKDSLNTAKKYLSEAAVKRLFEGV